MSAYSMMIKTDTKFIRCVGIYSAPATLLPLLSFWVVLNLRCKLQLLSAGGTGSCKTGESLQIHGCYAGR